MTTTDTTPALDEIRRAGLEVLRCEIGLVGMVRFIRQVSPGTGDYTAERDELVGHLTVDEIIDRIEKRRAAEAEREQNS